MAISGTFKASTDAYSVRESTRGPYRANWGTGVDPGHMGTEPLPAEARPTPAPVADVVPVEIEDPWTVRDPAPGEPYDYEPPGHEGIGTVPALVPGKVADELNGAARSIDRGANHTRRYPVVARDASETVTNGVFHTPDPRMGDRGDTGISGQALRALTGRNSLAPNNPGDPNVNFSGSYLRQGGELIRYKDRRLPTHGFLDHTKRPLHSNEAQGAKNSQPAPSAGRYGRMARNFARLDVGTTKPLQRREPRPWDEAIVGDGSDQTYESDAAQYETWSL